MNTLMSNILDEPETSAVLVAWASLDEATRNHPDLWVRAEPIEGPGAYGVVFGLKGSVSEIDRDLTADAANSAQCVGSARVQGSTVRPLATAAGTLRGA